MINECPQVKLDPSIHEYTLHFATHNTLWGLKSLYQSIHCKFLMNHKLRIAFCGYTLFGVSKAFEITHGRIKSFIQCLHWHIRADSRFGPSQWEMALLGNKISHWLGAILASPLCIMKWSKLAGSIVCRQQEYFDLSYDRDYLSRTKTVCHLTGHLWDSYLGAQSLTHWGRDKMATIFQMTLSNAFSWMKI